MKVKANRYTSFRFAIINSGIIMLGLCIFSACTSTTFPTQLPLETALNASTLPTTENVTKQSLLVETPSPYPNSTQTQMVAQTPTQNLQIAATSQAEPMLIVVNRIKEMGYIPNTQGTYHRVNGREYALTEANDRNLELIDGFYPSDFILRANISWNKPNARVAEKDNAACGFAFHVNTDGDYEMKMSIDGHALLRRLINSTQYSYKTMLIDQKPFREFQAQGDAEILLIVSGNDIILLIDGREVIKARDKFITTEGYRDGLLAFMMENGTVQGDMICVWKDMELWELDSAPSNKPLSPTELALPTLVLNAEGYYRRGMERYTQGDYEAALSEFTKAIELEPKAYVAYYARAVIFFARGDFPQALENINQTISLAPDLGAAYYRRAQIYERIGEAINAQRDYIKAEELGYQED